MKKNILILSSFPAPYRIAIFNGLSKYFNCDVFFFTDHDQNRDKRYYVSQQTSRYWVLNNKEDKKEFRRKTRRLNQYDLVLAYDWYLMFAINIELQCMIKKIPYIVNCDGAFISKEKSVKNLVKKLMISKSSIAFAGGNSAYSYFQYYGAKRIVRHNFTSLYKEDILQHCISSKEKVKLRQKLGFSSKKMVISIGQFIQRKGFDVLLKAWKDLDLSYQLVIIGGGEEYNSLNNIVCTNNYQNVKLIEYKTKEEIFEYYQAADLFVLPTREDIWGLVINEAMANGLPVVTTNRCLGGIQLVDNNNGKIVNAEDEIALHDAMELILKQNNLALGEESLNKIKEYTIENVVVSHRNAIANLLCPK